MSIPYLNQAVPASWGHVITLLDQELIISTIAAARKEFSEPFDAKTWVK